MSVRAKKEESKVFGTIKLDNKKQIVVTHLTIRQSIFFLVIKLFAIEILAAASLIYYLTNIYPSEIVNEFGLRAFLLPVFVMSVLIKTFFTVFTIVQWLEEYYEITPKQIVHRNGFIFKREEAYKLDHIGSLEINQNILGRIFNYGTISLYDWTIEKDIYLYLIHNPFKYHKILEGLLPDVDTKKTVFRRKLVDKE